MFSLWYFLIWPLRESLFLETFPQIVHVCSKTPGKCVSTWLLIILLWLFSFPHWLHLQITWPFAELYWLSDADITSSTSFISLSCSGSCHHRCIIGSFPSFLIGSVVNKFISIHGLVYVGASNYNPRVTNGGVGVWSMKGQPRGQRKAGREGLDLTLLCLVLTWQEVLPEYFLVVS